MARNQFLVYNSDNKKVKDMLRMLSSRSDEIRLAVAYITDNDLLDEWLQRKLKITLLVALQPPTDPSVLKKLLPWPLSKVEVKFFRLDFHSKLYLFYRNSKPFAALVGSSNFTGGGLASNRETNVYISANAHILPLEAHFNEMWREAALLSPEVVHSYQSLYNQTKISRDKLSAKLRSFEKRYIEPKLKGRRTKAIKEALDYYSFWKCVNEVVENVRLISFKEWPTVRPYLTVDHFWHWIVSEWDRTNLSRIQSDAAFRKGRLPKLFKQYADWDKSKNNRTAGMKKTANQLYSLLKPAKIYRLTKAQARDIYALLHSGAMLTQRFSSNEKFAEVNNLDKIKNSLDYLLWSSDDITQRISALLVNPKFKLTHFGPSNIQELLGWVLKEFPLRNDKADRAVELLGYKFR